MTNEEFREIIVHSKSSYKFLGAEEGYWIKTDKDGEDRKCLIDEMPKKHKTNCINYLKRHRENIKKGQFLHGVELDIKKRAEYDELVRLGCEAMERKIKELSL